MAANEINYDVYNFDKNEEQCVSTKYKYSNKCFFIIIKSTEGEKNPTFEHQGN
jgi:subtilase family serine protease